MTCSKSTYRSDMFSVIWLFCIGSPLWDLRVDIIYRFCNCFTWYVNIFASYWPIGWLMGPHHVVWSPDEDLLIETCWLTTGLLMIQPLKSFLIFLFSFDTCLSRDFFPLSNWGSKHRGWCSLYRLKPMGATWFVILGYKNSYFWSAWIASGFCRLQHFAKL